MTDSKRKYTRIDFATDCLLENNSTGQAWNTQLHDLSLKGALVEQPSEWQASVGDAFVLKIPLGEDVTIEMQTHIAHAENHHVGLTCEHIDIDSISHLRRVVELNIGDEELLERELSELIGTGS